MRQQVSILQDRGEGVSEAQARLLQEQLDARGVEVTALRGRVTEVEAERDRALQVRSGRAAGAQPEQLNR